MPDVAMKRCSRCSEVKPLDSFPPDKRKPGGLAYACRGCYVERVREWRQANPAADRKWGRANAERLRAYRRRRYQENIVAAREALAIRVASYEARKRGAYVERVHPLVVLERADGVCGICGSDVDPTKFEVDHITPLARGGEHSYANTQPSHPACNRSKGAKADFQIDPQLAVAGRYSGAEEN